MIMPAKSVQTGRIEAAVARMTTAALTARGAGAASADARPASAAATAGAHDDGQSRSREQDSLPRYPD